MIRRLSLAVALVATLGLGAVGRAQEPADEAVDGLLKKLEDTRPADNPAREDDPGRPADKAEAGPDGARKDDGTGGEVAPKDQAIDSILEKLGEAEETPAPDGRPPGGAPDDATPPQPGRVKDDLKGRDKDLDEHLEELSGRKKKRKQEQQGGGGGPLGELIKQMRDVEQRLGKPDTGEDTRKEQQQIVKEIDRLIEAVRESQGQGGGKIRSIRMAKGNQPGQQDGQGSQGNNAKGVGAGKPQRPTGERSPNNNKDIWGHLAKALREEMENVFKEEALPAKSRMIDRYYLLLNEKFRDKE